MREVLEGSGGQTVLIFHLLSLFVVQGCYLAVGLFPQQGLLLQHEDEEHEQSQTDLRQPHKEDGRVLELKLLELKEIVEMLVHLFTLFFLLINPFTSVEYHQDVRRYC